VIFYAEDQAIINIENVVASATLNQRVDLNAIVKGFPGGVPSRTVTGLSV
jgi:TATA-box binding protein (TBP) (component of TFIID and TFIIIB)